MRAKTAAERLWTRPALDPGHALPGMLVTLLCLATTSAVLIAAEDPARTNATLELNGIVTFSENTLALIESTIPRRAPQALLLSAGQREGDLEVLEIDEARGVVRVNQAGTVTDLSFANDSDNQAIVHPSAQTTARPEPFVTFRLQNATVNQMFDLYQRVLQRSLLRPATIPFARLTLRSSQPISSEDFARAVERAFAEKGVMLKPHGEKFAIAAMNDDLEKLAPQLREIAETLAMPLAGNQTVVGQDVLGPGMIFFKAVDVNSFLMIYQELANRTLLRPGTLPSPLLSFRNQTALTRAEALYALAAVLALNGISVLPAGDKFLMVFPSRQREKALRLAALEVSPAATPGQNGAINLSGVDLRQLAKLYSDLCGCTVDIASGVSPGAWTFKTQTTLTRNEALHGFDLLLGLNGLKTILQEDGKTRKIVRDDN